jgi:hypothetical protein
MVWYVVCHRALHRPDYGSKIMYHAFFLFVGSWVEDILVPSVRAYDSDSVGIIWNYASGLRK